MRSFNNMKDSLASVLMNYSNFKVDNFSNYSVMRFNYENDYYRIILSKTSMTGSDRPKPQIRVFTDKIREHLIESKNLNEKFFSIVHCSTETELLKYEDFPYWDYLVFLESDFNTKKIRVDIRSIYDEFNNHFLNEANGHYKINVSEKKDMQIKYATAFHIEEQQEIINYLKYYESRIFISDTKNALDTLDELETDVEVELIDRNIIYVGAPGTGKSFQLKEDALTFKNRAERVTFYPTLTYGQFVGAFKPFPENDTITYKYIPGPLIKQLVKALLNPEENYLLIIEELNRANASAVFGDTFQLIERDLHGNSVYKIHISYELNYYLEKELYKTLDENKIASLKESLKEGLYFPKNLYIWATMNSADQGVIPIDTAFKRRWERRYFGINEASEKNELLFENYKQIVLPNNNDSNIISKILWNDLRQFINEQLTRLRVPEDKLLGPYFISENILTSSDKAVTQSFKDKVLSYLFEDAVKQKRSSLFTLREEDLRYSELITQFDKIGLEIFKDHDKLNDKIIISFIEDI